MAYSTLALLSFLFVLIADVLVRVNSFIGVSNGAAVAAMILNVLSVTALLTIAARHRIATRLPSTAWLFFKLFMIWNVISLGRGAFKAANYWDWKFLIFEYFFSILVPLAMILGLNYEVAIRFFRFVLTKLFLFGFLLIPFSLAYDYELYPRLVLPVGLFLLFVPYLKLRWGLLVVLVALVSVGMNLDYRTNLIRISFAFLLLLAYFLRGFAGRGGLNAVAVMSFVLPLVLLFLGVTNQFNIFRDQVSFDGEYSVVGGGEVTSTNLAADTRTLIYQEVFYSMLGRNSSFFIGEGGGVGYETMLFSDLHSYASSGRSATEVGFLNALQYSGVLGVFLYALMILVSAYYGINRSRNHLCKMLSIFLIFHWVLFFLEDRTKMDMNFYCIWLAVGLCLSNKFRLMDDAEVKDFFSVVVMPWSALVDRGRLKTNLQAIW